MNIFPYVHIYVKSEPGPRSLVPATAPLAAGRALGQDPLYSRTFSGSVAFSPLPIWSDSIRIRE